jgi:hypothetical protein
MPSIESTHIQLTLYCPECGHEWDIEDYDSNSVDDAISKAKNQLCPRSCPNVEE